MNELKSDEKNKTRSLFVSLITLSKHFLLDKLKMNKTNKRIIAASVVKVKCNYLTKLLRKRVEAYRKNRKYNQEVKSYLKRKR
jgi:hypothetical protein